MTVGKWDYYFKTEKIMCVTIQSLRETHWTCLLHPTYIGVPRVGVPSHHKSLCSKRWEDKGSVLLLPPHLKSHDVTGPFPVGFGRVGSVTENRVISKWGQTGVGLTETSRDIFTAQI